MKLVLMKSFKYSMLHLEVTVASYRNKSLINVTT